jgi:hypothetical protein
MSGLEVADYKGREWVRPNVIKRHYLNCFLFTFRLVSSGSRFMLFINGTDSGARQQNFNSGRVVADETPENARPAPIKLHQDENHRSVLALPIGQ